MFPIATTLLRTTPLPPSRLWEQFSNTFWGEAESKMLIFKALVGFLFSAPIHFFKRLEMITPVLRRQCWTNPSLGTFLIRRKLSWDLKKKANLETDRAKGAGNTNKKKYLSDWQSVDDSMWSGVKIRNSYWPKLLVPWSYNFMRLISKNIDKLS